MYKMSRSTPYLQRKFKIFCNFYDVKTYISILFLQFFSTLAELHPVLGNVIIKTDSLIIDSSIDILKILVFRIQARNREKYKAIYFFHRQVAGVFTITHHCTFLRITSYDALSVRN